MHAAKLRNAAVVVSGRCCVVPRQQQLEPFHTQTISAEGAIVGSMVLDDWGRRKHYNDIEFGAVDSI